MADHNTRRLYHLFAEILDYPYESLAAKARECAERLAVLSAEAAEDMRSFVAFAEREGLCRMEEVYTRTFDVTPTTTPYVGYHLFGESYKRGAFLVRLQEEYRQHGYEFGPELADHLAVVLRFLSLVDEPEFVIPLLGECLLPVAGRMERAFEGNENGYKLVVSALKVFLERTTNLKVAVSDIKRPLFASVDACSSPLETNCPGGPQDD